MNKITTIVSFFLAFSPLSHASNQNNQPPGTKLALYFAMSLSSRHDGSYYYCTKNNDCCADSQDESACD